MKNSATVLLMKIIKSNIKSHINKSITSRKRVWIIILKKVWNATFYLILLPLIVLYLIVLICHCLVACLKRIAQIFWSGVVWGTYPQIVVGSTTFSPTKNFKNSKTNHRPGWGMRWVAATNPVKTKLTNKLINTLTSVTVRDFGNKSQETSVCDECVMCVM